MGGDALLGMNVFEVDFFLLKMSGYYHIPTTCTTIWYYAHISEWDKSMCYAFENSARYQNRLNRAWILVGCGIFSWPKVIRIENPNFSRY